MRPCIDCSEPATHRGRCEAHFTAHQARPGVRARQRRTEALRAGSDAAAVLRRSIRGTLVKCAHCERQFVASQVDIDHIRPLYQGGEDVPENLQLLCRSFTGRVGCHQIKTLTDAGKAPF